MQDGSAVVAAGTLAVLWVFEGVAPGLRGSPAGVGQRMRHLVLGLLNAAVGIAVVGVLFLADGLAERTGFGLLRGPEALPWWACVVIAFVLLDLWHYLCHVMMHHVPVLWRFHAVHHNADKLEATVAMRFHAAEVAVQGLATVPLVVLLGIGIEHVAIYNIVLLPVAMFHHADVRLSRRMDRLLRLLIVTPRLHWLHHSRWHEETDSNYASVLSIWDRVFRTMRTRRRAEAVEIGLDGFDEAQIKTVGGMLATPFSSARSGLGDRPDERALEPDGARPTRPGAMARLRRMRAARRAGEGAPTPGR